MKSNSTAKISFLKKELVLLMAIVESEKQRYDAIDYEKLSDDEATDVGYDHEIIDGILRMLKASYENVFK